MAAVREYVGGECGDWPEIEEGIHFVDRNLCLDPFVCCFGSWTLRFRASMYGAHRRMRWLFYGPTPLRRFSRGWILPLSAKFKRLDIIWRYHISFLPEATSTC